MVTEEDIKELIKKYEEENRKIPVFSFITDLDPRDHYIVLNRDRNEVQLTGGVKYHMPYERKFVNHLLLDIINLIKDGMIYGFKIFLNYDRNNRRAVTIYVPFESVCYLAYSPLFKLSIRNPRTTDESFDNAGSLSTGLKNIKARISFNFDEDYSTNPSPYSWSDIEMKLREAFEGKSSKVFLLPRDLIDRRIKEGYKVDPRKLTDELYIGVVPFKASDIIAEVVKSKTWGFAQVKRNMLMTLGDEEKLYQASSHLPVYIVERKDKSSFKVITYFGIKDVQLDDFSSDEKNIFGYEICGRNIQCVTYEES